MIMTTFTDRLNFRDKPLHPVTTYAMSRMGTTARDYAASCPDATIARGLAVQGDKVEDADTEIRAWLQRANLPSRCPGSATARLALLRERPCHGNI